MHIYFQCEKEIKAAASQVCHHFTFPVEEDECDFLNDFLFEPNFEAWAYGPVDPEVYQEYRRDNSFDAAKADAFEESLDDLLKAFLEDYTERIFNTSDFTLVDLSHRDKCWKNRYDINDLYHNEKIPGEESISEYASRI